MQLSIEQVQEILDFGDAAKELLENPAFLHVIDTLSSYHLSALVAAPPGESGKDARDYHHQQHYALREIGTEIQSRIAAAAGLRSELERDTDEEDL